METEPSKDTPLDLRALGWLTTLVRPYRGRLAFAALALVASGAVSLVLPAVAGTVVDAALVEENLDRLGTVIGGLFVLFAVSAAFDFFETYLLRSTAARILRDLRVKLHGHLLTLTPSFFEKERVGDLISRLSTDVTAIGQVLTRDLVGALQQTLILVGSLTILATLHPRLTGVMLLAVPPVVVVAVLFGLRFEKLSKAHQKRAADATVAAEESLAGIRTVQSFGREALERARYLGLTNAALELALRLARAWGAFGALVGFFSFSAFALVLWYGGRLVIEDELTPGDLTSFLLYTLMVAGAVGTITSVYGALKSAAGATARVRELLDTDPAIQDPDSPVELGRPRGRVELSGISFAYPTKPDQLAVADVDLRIEPGQVVALVGPSGSGKSTLATLLLRFHDPTRGRVLLDGTDLRDLRLADVRAAIGLVSQEVFLFGGTVEENIRYGRPEATDDEVREAARAAHAHDFVSRLPDGYATVVGERGVRLSAGERQRVSIARVLLEDPAVVVLDEATSALDAESSTWSRGPSSVCSSTARRS